jgi:hypothetical protein
MTDETSGKKMLYAKIRKLASLTCAAFVLSIGCSRSSGKLPSNQISRPDSLGPEIIEEIKHASEFATVLMTKYQGMNDANLSDEVGLKIALEQLDVIEDAISQLAPRTWNFVRLKDPELFTPRDYDLSKWEDMKGKLTNRQYRIQAIERHLKDEGYEL